MARADPACKEHKNKKSSELCVPIPAPGTTAIQETLIPNSTENQLEKREEHEFKDEIPRYCSLGSGEGGNYEHLPDEGILEDFLLVAGLTAIECTHWLEVLDPLHRYGTFLRPYYDAWLSIGAPDSFFSWLDGGDGVAMDLEGAIGFGSKVVSREILERSRVWYCTERERERYRVIVQDGLLVWASDNAPFGQGKMNRVQTDSEVKWIFVIDVSGEMYVWRKKKGSFHHSSFTAGGPVLAAGRIAVDDGNVVCIGPNSGHYRTTWEQLLFALDDFFGESGLQILPPVSCGTHEAECIRVVSPCYAESY